MLLDDLKAVAKLLNKATVRYNEYNVHGTYHASTLSQRFESWNNALVKAGLLIHGKRKIIEMPLFINLQQLWIILGRQPRRKDLIPPHSKYSASIYRTTFGGWQKALEAFITYANDHPIVGTAIEFATTEKLPGKPSHRTNRSISTRQRFVVMQRDNFRCVACGKSPATDAGTVLHVDHIVPWSKGGESTAENLQTLCATCNWGKSDL